MRVSCNNCGMMVVASYLKEHMMRIHSICILQTRGVDKVGEGSTTYVVSLPKVLQKVKCLVKGCLMVAHSAGQLQALSVQGDGGSRGGGYATPLLLVQNSHASREAHQTTADGKMRQEHLDVVAEKRCGDCGQVLGGNLYPHKGGRSRVHWGSRKFQVPRAASGPVG